MDYSVATLRAATAEVAAGTPLEPMYELADAAAIATAPAAEGQPSAAAPAAAASAVAPDASSPAGKYLYEGRCTPLRLSHHVCCSLLSARRLPSATSPSLATAPFIAKRICSYLLFLLAPGRQNLCTSPRPLIRALLHADRYGLPVVRRYLQYHELLRDIRLERVMEVMFFSQPYDLDPDPPVGHPEGPCLVLYKCASLLGLVLGQLSGLGSHQGSVTPL